jgi:ATP-dependent DNA ligase
MILPIQPPFLPMEALSVKNIPEGPNWQYEPKWDGFRCLAFRSGDEVMLQSKSGKSLSRYFPEVVAFLRDLKARMFVLDGEISVPAQDGVSFDHLLLRIHPAASRVKKLAAEHPAIFVVFDLLVDQSGKSLVRWPLSRRRLELEKFSKKYFKRESLFISPATRKVSVARRWFQQAGEGLDGVVAKRLDLPYQSAERTGMQKIKELRTVDCVVGGFRFAHKKKEVGSLLLGLYDDAGLLHHVGFTSSFGSIYRRDLTSKLTRLIHPPGFTGRAPGGPSRWSTERSGEWKPLKPKLVAEVQYDHFTERRFRHGTKFLRWRPDKSPKECSFDQVRTGLGTSLRLL